MRQILECKVSFKLAYGKMMQDCGTTMDVVFVFHGVFVNVERDLLISFQIGLWEDDARLWHNYGCRIRLPWRFRKCGERFADFLGPKPRNNIICACLMKYES
jgi:hypothetical protein